MSETFFHIGILVKDIRAAMERFSAVLGVTFNEPTVVHFNRLEDPDPHEFDALVTYSRQGPPYWELMEARDTGLYSLEQHGEGIHHVGIWESDNAAKTAEFHRQGLRVPMRIVAEDGSTFVWFNDPTQLDGVRIEYVDDANRAAIEEWIATGVMEGGFNV